MKGFIDISALIKAAAQHRFTHSWLRGHHAAVVVYENIPLWWTLSLNQGREHAETRALRTFQARAGQWCLKGGYCSS
jgi:hypothetical protein